MVAPQVGKAGTNEEVIGTAVVVEVPPEEAACPIAARFLTLYCVGETIWIVGNAPSYRALETFSRSTFAPACELDRPCGVEVVTVTTPNASTEIAEMTA